MTKKFLILSLLISIVVFSCGKEEDSAKPNLVKMRINHYQQPVNNEEYFKGLAFLVQEGDEMGSEIWYPLLNTISGFDYDLGYVYEIEVKKNEINEPLIDDPGIKYVFERVVSKTRVPANTTFNIIIAFNYTNGFESLVEKNEASQYTLMGETVIETGAFYDALEEGLANQYGIKGTFSHVDDQSLRLEDLQIYEE